jgi:hypothetical protein
MAPVPEGGVLPASSALAWGTLAQNKGMNAERGLHRVAHDNRLDFKFVDGIAQHIVTGRYVLLMFLMYLLIDLRSLVACMAADMDEMVYVREEESFYWKFGKAEPAPKIPEDTVIKAFWWGIPIQGGLGFTPISPYDQHIRLSLCGLGSEPSAKDRKKAVVFSSGNDRLSLRRGCLQIRIPREKFFDFNWHLLYPR